MNSLTKKCLAALLLLSLLAMHVQLVEAAKGVPGSPEFGFGVLVYPDGPMVEEALYLLNDLQPDWLYVPVSWAASQPAVDAQPDLAALDRVMAAAGRKKIAVVLSVTQAPGWAQTAAGPDAQTAAQFAALLAQRYPETVQALELFPRANTLIGWGSAPNPQAYLALFQAVQARLSADGRPVLLVAAGLQPLGKDPANIDPAVEMSDLAFLQGLYDAGGRAILRVVSLQYADVSADLMASPFEAHDMIFRHYELVRASMLANAHADGLIWITAFNLPSGAYGKAKANGTDLYQQKDWLQQAYFQVHSQLYIGAAVLQSLNSAPASTPNRIAAVIQPNGSHHPFYQLLRQMTFDNNPDSTSSRPGSSKMGSLLKKRQ